METWGIVVVIAEVTLAIIFILFGSYIVLFPKKPEKLTAEDLMLKEDNDVKQLPK